jgi:hypothetical protein
MLFHKERGTSSISGAKRLLLNAGCPLRGFVLTVAGVYFPGSEAIGTAALRNFRYA